jgi:RimJ/RimL family protein N-acetyltransferase
MKNSNYIFTLAKNENFNDYLKLRSEKKNLYWTGYKNPPDYDSFLVWYKNRLLNPDRGIYLIYEEDNLLGALHIDFYGEYAAIGYSVKEKSEGKGIGTFLVKKAIELVISEKKNRDRLTKIIAWINEKNIASRRVIEKNEFNKSNVCEKRLRFGIEEIYYQFEKLF